MSKQFKFESVKTVVVFSQNSALSSILHMVLAQNKELRVRQFNDEKSLIQYINIAVIDLLIYDCEQIDENLISSISLLRKTHDVSNSKFQIIALSKTIPKGIRTICKTISIDEIIVKPMSPIYLETRVLVRLGQALKQHSLASSQFSKSRRLSDKLPIAKRISSDFNSIEKSNNVIPLFGKRNIATPPSQLN